MIVEHPIDTRAPWPAALPPSSTNAKHRSTHDGALRTFHHRVQSNVLDRRHRHCNVAWQVRLDTAREPENPRGSRGARSSPSVTVPNHRPR